MDRLGVGLDLCSSAFFMHFGSYIFFLVYALLWSFSFYALLRLTVAMSWLKSILLQDKQLEGSQAIIIRGGQNLAR